MVLRRIGALSCAKMGCALYGILGLIAGFFFAVFSLFGAALGIASESGGAFLSALFGVGAVVFLPLVYGVIGFLGGLIIAALYNWLAGIVGGVEIKLEEV